KSIRERCGRRAFHATNERPRVALVVHGPKQLLGAAMRPSWPERQSRADFDPFASSACIPLAIAVSVVADGANRNARSLRLPSPFTSPDTIGVNRVPDRTCPLQLMVRKSKTV